MSDKPSLNFDTGDDHAPGFEQDYLNEQTERSRVKFNTRLRADLYEKLRAAAFWTGESITDLVEDAMRHHIARLEDEHGEPFDVLPPHRVDDS
jgi:hypothetical protein